MKSDVTPSIVDESILKSIIEVKETVATMTNDNKSRRAFTAADLWHIQRKAILASGAVRR
jgi:hypothetical protein